MNREAVKNIVAALGAETITEALGVTTHSVRAAITSGSFSASWYRVLSDLCVEAECPCPLDAFNFKGADQPAMGCDHLHEASGFEQPGVCHE